LKTELELDPLQKRNTVQVLKLQKNEKINSLKMEVTKAYFTYLMIQEQLASQDKAMERLNKKLEIVKAQVAAGVLNKTALSDIEVALKLVDQQKTLLTRDLSNISMRVNSLLGQPIKAVFKIAKQDIPVPDLNINLEQLIVEKNTKSSKLLQALNTKAEAKIQYDITNFSSLKVIPDGIEQAENQLLNATYDYNNLLSSQECDILNEYNSLLNLKDDVDIKKLKLDVSEKELKKAKAEYDLGLIDVIKYNSTIQSNEDLVTAYKNAQLDYFIAAETFIN
jgi:outer membrane protein TolC